MTAETAKRLAAARAIEFVQSGMRLGLGTGSTAKHFVELLAERVRNGCQVIGVPTSEATRAQAEALGIPLTTLDQTPELDLTVDGADEFDPELRLIKGGGGALLREKIVATASKRMVVIADATKRVEILGRFPLPVEVVRFGREATRRALMATAARYGCTGDVVLRVDAAGAPFVTDEGHHIFDCHFGRIQNADALAGALNTVPGIVEHGLFIGLARSVIVADAAGVVVLGDTH